MDERFILRYNISIDKVIGHFGHRHSIRRGRNRHVVALFFCVIFLPVSPHDGQSRMYIVAESIYFMPI